MQRHSQNSIGAAAKKLDFQQIMLHLVDSASGAYIGSPVAGEVAEHKDQCDARHRGDRPVLGAGRANEPVAAVGNLDRIDSVSSLGRLLQA
jgi:hypothetical protein